MRPSSRRLEGSRDLATTLVKDCRILALWLDALGRHAVRQADSPQGRHTAREHHQHARQDLPDASPSRTRCHHRSSFRRSASSHSPSRFCLWAVVEEGREVALQVAPAQLPALDGDPIERIPAATQSHAFFLSILFPRYRTRHPSHLYASEVRTPSALSKSQLNCRRDCIDLTEFDSPVAPPTCRLPSL